MHYCSQGVQALIFITLLEELQVDNLEQYKELAHWTTNGLLLIKDKGLIILIKKHG